MSHSPPTTFGARLTALMAARGPLCVGIDPHAALLRAWGVGDDVTGLRRFCAVVVDALAGQVAVLKPQSAFFERFGAAGVAVLEQTLVGIRAGGALALLDVKRGDIGSTMAAYAEAYLDPASPLVADAVTASPYLGFDSLQPLLEAASRHQRGVFVLALTSNSEGASVQHARTAAGRTVAQGILDDIAAANAGQDPLGSVGAVIGATIGRTGHDFAALNGPILAPGVGAQGGTVADLRSLFGSAMRGVLASTSRDVLAAGPAVSALRAAAVRLSTELTA